MFIAKSIRKLMLENGWSEGELSRRSGVNQPTIHRIITGTSKDPRNNTLDKIAKAFGSTAEELRRNQIEHKSNSSLFTLAKKQDNGKVTVPIIDVEVSAGAGTLIEDEQISEMAHIDREWLRQNTGVNPTHRLAIVKVTGDSMTPTYNAGDLIVVDLDDPSVKNNNPLTDGIFCIRIGEQHRIKRLQLTAAGMVRIISDNPMYPSEEIDPSLLNITARAHFTWRGSRC